MIFVFKCIGGLGNRLCNLFNMFYLHKIYPAAEIYLVWSINNHCGAKLDDLIDMSEHTWIRSESEYLSRVYPRFHQALSYAYSNRREQTRWDILDVWKNHNVIVSVTISLYMFVPQEFCVETYNGFKLPSHVTSIIEERINRYGDRRELVHFRTGDMLRILDDERGSYRVRLTEKFEAIKGEFPSALIVEYAQMVVDRPALSVIEAFAELAFYIKHCRVVAYTPYSWFSSLVIFLNRDYRVDLPVFDTEKLCIVVV